MKHFTSCSLKRKSALAVCAFLACAVMALGLVFANPVRSYVEETARAETTERTVAAENNYTSVEADVYKQGVAIYANVTTAAQLKQNLAVYGTFSDDSGISHKVLLSDAEYSLSVQINDYPAEIKEDGELILETAEEIPADMTISVYVHCNGVEEKVATVFGVASIKTEYPSYTSITVGNIGTIDNDYTAQSLRVLSSFTVLDENKKEIVNREFYEISLDLKSRTVGAKLNGTGSFVTGTISSVRAVNPLSASITVNKDLIKQGDYYKIAEGGKATNYSAFVAGMQHETIFKSLSVTAYYEHSVKPVTLQFDGGGNLQGTAKTDIADITVVWPGGNAPSLNTPNIRFNLSLIVASATASVEFPLEEEKVIAIEAKDYSFPDVLYADSSVPIEQLDGHVIPTYNSDYYSDTERAALIAGEYAVTDSLAPTAEIIAGNLIYDGGDGNKYYDKTVNVVYNADTTITAPITVKVLFEEVKLISLGGTPVAQTYRRAFDFSGLTLTFTYEYNSIVIPLSDFVLEGDAAEEEKFVRVIYYSDDKYINQIEVNTFTLDVKSVKVQFRYDRSIDWTSTSGIYTMQATTTWKAGDRISKPLSINKLPLSAPNLDTSSQTYYSGLEKEFSFGDDIDDDIISKLSITVEKLNAESDNWEQIDFGSFDVLAKKKIPISAGGEYRVSFTLEGLEDVRWSTVSGNTVTFNFTVTPSDLDLKIIFDRDEWTYGDDFITGNISIIGIPRGLTLELPIGPDKELNLSYGILYYPVDGGAAVEFPKDAGEYYAVVQTLANGTFNAASSPAANRYSGAPVVTVKPKTLNATTLNKNILYDGNAHSVSEFVSPEGFVVKTLSYTYYGAVKRVTYADDIDGVLEYDRTTTYTHVSENPASPLTISINADNGNYVWDGVTGKDTTITIEITARELSFTVGNDGLGYTYGGKRGSETLTGAPIPTADNYTFYNAAGVVCGEGDFFAVLDGVEYYKADASGKPVGNKLDATEFASWDAGSYVIKFLTRLGDGDELTDYAGGLPVAYATFTISRAQISQLTLSSDTAVYDGSIHTASLDNWQDGIMKTSVTAVLHGGNTAFTAGFDSESLVEDLTVKYAGVYTLTVSLTSNNYDWELSSDEISNGDSAHKDLVFVFTVEKAKIEFSWKQPADVGGALTENSNGFDAGKNQMFPTATATNAAATADGLNLVVGVYDDADCTSKQGDAPDAGITEAGNYYVKVYAFNADTADGYDLADNYELSNVLETYYKKAFSILSAGLEAVRLVSDGADGTVITSDTVTVIYNANARYIYEFIENWAENYTYGANGSKWKLNISVTATGDTPVGFEPVTNGGMTDVCTYDITVKPETNFKWVDDKDGNYEYEVTLRFVIVQAELGLDWGDLAADRTFVYSGAKQAPAVKNLTGVFDSDKNNVTVNVTDDSKKINASEAKYTATAAAPSGTRGFNYKLPADNTTDFIINKYTVTVPSLTSAPENYGSADKKVVFNLPELADLGGAWNWSDWFVETAVRGQYRFEGLAVNHADRYTFDWTSKGFEAVNAGTYTVTFTLKDTTNFNWSSGGTGKVEGKVYTAEEFTVARKQITAPILGEEVEGKTVSHRTMEYAAGAECIPDLIWGAGVESLVKGITYGSYDRNAAEGTDPYGAEVSPTAVGEYYVRLKLDGGINSLNYEWAENESDSVANLEGFVSHYGKIVYSYSSGSADVSIYINFAITQHIINVDYKIGGYTFGANGAGMVTDAAKMFNSVVSMIENDEISGLTVKYTQTFTFTDKDGNKAGEVLIDGDGNISLAGTDNSALENLLPWNAGDYKVTIKIEFGSDQLEDRVFTQDSNGNAYVLKVSPKTLNAKDVEWSGKEEVAYDGNAHTLTATVKADSVPQRADGGEAAPALTVKLTDGTLPVNASDSAYTLIVYAIEDTDKGLAANYARPETDISALLTIIKRTVKVGVTETPEFVYGSVSGNDIATDKYWSYPDGAPNTAKFVEDTDYIVYELYDVENNKVYPVTSSALLDAADYRLVPVLNAAGALNYTLATDCTAGTLKVLPRKLALSLNGGEGARKSVYGETVDLYSKLVYSVKFTNGEGDWLAEELTTQNIEKVFKLTSDATAQYANAGDYDINVQIIDNANYSVNVVGGGAINPYVWENAYTVLKADIVNPSAVAVTGKEYKAVAYNYIVGLLTVSADITNQSANPAHWWIAEKAGAYESASPAADYAGWADITALTQTDAIDKDYWVKVTAANHNAVVLENPVNIKIAKATIYVQVGLSIYYGENSPVKYNGTDLYQGGLDALKAAGTQGSIYAVTGLQGGDTLSALDIGGTFGYEVADYSVGKEAGDYVITFDGSSLESTNYVFAASETAGKLEVKKLPVTITLENRLGQIYWELVGDNYNLNDYVKVETHCESSYGNGLVVIHNTKDDIATAYTKAITVDNGKVADMLGIGKYPLYVVLGGAVGNYDYEVVIDGENWSGTDTDVPENAYTELVGVFEIVSADFDIVTEIGASYTTKYTETYHTFKTAAGEYVTADTVFATKKNDGSAAKVDFHAYAGAAELADKNGADVVWSDTLPEYIDANKSAEKYYLYYRISADNHTTIISYITVTIEKATDNAFETAFDFANGYAYEDDNIENNAWTYGVYDAAKNPDGYNADGNQRITSPQTKYGRNAGDAEGVKSNKIEYSLWLVADETQLATGYTEATDLDGLFAYVLSRGEFGAGVYRLDYKLGGNDNYEGISDSRYFGIAKKDLTITAAAISVVYGEDLAAADYYLGVTANGYNFNVAGLVDSGAGMDTNADIYADGKLPVLTSTYSKGAENGGVKDYAIGVSNASELSEENYSVTINLDNKLTVTKREVVIGVTDKSSLYDFNAASGTSAEKETEYGYKALEFETLEGSFFGGDGEVITLVTNARDETQTKDVGVYPVFVMFTDKGHRANYEISVNGSFNKTAADKADEEYGKNIGYYDSAVEYFGTLDSELVIGDISSLSGGNSCAGTYSILPAYLSINPGYMSWWDGEKFVRYSESQREPEGSHIYDGKYKGYVTTPRNPESEPGKYDSLTITAKYQDDNGAFTLDYVKDVGEHAYYYEIDDTNFTYSRSQDNILAITPQNLGRRVTVNGVSSGGLESYEQTYKHNDTDKTHTLVYEFTRLIGEEVVGIDVAFTADKLGGTHPMFNSVNLKNTSAATMSGNVFTLTAKNAGSYSVTLKLNGDMLNYSYAGIDGGDITTENGIKVIKFTLNINRYSLGVTANAADVEYGSPLNADSVDAGRFTGFSLKQQWLDLADIENAVEKGVKYFDCAGVTFVTKSSDGKQYSSASSQSAAAGGEGFNIIPEAASIQSLNYNIVTEGANFDYGRLTVLQRNITVVLNGYISNTATSWASVEYDGNARQPDLENNLNGFLTPDGGWYGDTKDYLATIITAARIALRIDDNCINADNYPMYISQSRSNTNYRVTFVNSDNEELGTDTPAEKRPVFNIRPKDIQIQVVKKDTTDTVFDILYGNLSAPYYGVRYIGLVDRDKGENEFSYNIVNTADYPELVKGTLSYTANLIVGSGTSSYVYSPWKSHSGEAYRVSVKGLTFGNYNVTGWLTATMNVIPRPVTASTEDRVYTDLENYNWGISGIEHNAQITFKDGVNCGINNPGVYYTGTEDIYGNIVYNGFDGDISYDKDALAPAPNNYISRFYTGRGFDNEYELKNSATAPVKAGNYKVRVTLPENGDYVIVTDGGNVYETEFSFNVDKKLITGLMWSKNSGLSFEAGQPELEVNTIEGYLSQLMVVNSFQRRLGDDIENIEFNGQGNNSYTYGEIKKLTVNIYNIGDYYIIIELNSNAANNYSWGEDIVNVTLVFSVAANGVSIENLFIADWTYGSRESEPETRLSIEMVNVEIEYKYVEVSDIAEGTLSHMLSGDELSIVPTGGFRSVIPQNAGYYILWAHYRGNAQLSSADAYYLFRINSKKVTAPVFGNSQSEFESTYKGELISAIIENYNSDMFDYRYSGQADIDGSVITLLATDVADYTILFVLKNPEGYTNYVWEDGTQTQNGAVVLVWSIVKTYDNKVTVTVPEEAVTYGGLLEYSASDKYGAEITYLFAPRTGSAAPSESSSLWTKDIPVNAGEYWIVAVGGDTKNFAAARSEAGKITIAKAELKVTAHGDMVYGDTFGSDACSFGYTFEGFVLGDDERNVKVDGVNYALTEDYGKLNAGEYGIILDNVDGTVSGMAADNYFITAVSGAFNVHKRDVDVTLGDAESYYGQLIDLGNISITVSPRTPLVGGDDLSALNITPVIDKADLEYEFNDVWAYRVYAEGYTESENYNVNIQGFGIYTVNPLEIYITVEAGGGVYLGETTPATLTGIYAVNGEDGVDIRETFKELAPTFSFNYWGRANDGTTVAPSQVIPSLAGTYYATAVASNSRNFSLVTHLGTPSVTFVIAKRVIDESLISAAAQKYTGNDISPVISDSAYNGIYTVEEVAVRNVGNYTVTLTLKDYANNRWTSADGAAYNLAFEIVKGDNAFTQDVTIENWTYGQQNNLPVTKTRFGVSDDYVYTYSGEENGTYTATVPTSAGTYWVKVTVPQSDNYNAVTSDAVSFEIAKLAVNAPQLVFVNEGENQNLTYSGARLQAAVTGFDSAVMRIVYEGEMSSGNNIAVFALNAGKYTVRFVLNNPDNYEWTETKDEDAVLEWVVNRKKIEKPTMNTSMFMVNGRTLTFIPVGFDESTMDISGNRTSYGGAFEVTVSIKDTLNYEWADGSVEDITFDWIVVGWDTVFVIVISVLGVGVGVAAIAIGAQYLLHRRKKRSEALQAAAAAQALSEISAANPAETAENNSEEVNKEQTEEKPKTEEEHKEDGENE